MSGYDPATLALIQERIRRMVDDGMSDKEIDDALLWDWHDGEQWRQIAQYRHQYRQVGEPPDRMTPDAKRYKQTIEDEARRMQRSIKRGWTYQGLATRTGLDRNTISTWHKKGWLNLP